MTILAFGVFLQHAASAATITVTTASDDDSPVIGRTTLRQAITTANKTTSADVIVFEIRAGQDRTIDLTSELPHLTSNISIINKGDPVTVQRSTLVRTPSFRIFTITRGNTIVMEGLIIARGVGGVLNEGSTLSMRNCTLHHNTNSYSGGAAIDNKSDEDSGPAILTLNNCTLSENSTSHAPLYFYEYGGGAIRNLAYKTGASASATLNNCVLRQNSTIYYPPPDGSGGLPTFSTPPGAAIASIGSSGGVANLNLTGCTLENNTTPSGGGAIYNLGIGVAGSGSAASLRLLDCTLRNNSAGSGGAVDTSNSEPSTVVNLEKCTLAGNQVSSRGGAINSGRGQVVLTNCTLSGNEAVTSNAGVNSKPGGGAIYNSDGTLSVTNCTFKDNRADDDSRASSIYNYGAGTVTTANSIYDRVGGSDVHFVNEGTFTSRGHNICDDSAGGPLGTGPGGLLNATGDRRVTSPGLLALAANGGPTQTCALEQNSVAINAGDDAIAPPTDQRGYARSGVSDIGAFERSTATPVSLKPGRLGNISTRLVVETGDNALIAGFIVTGTEPKRVMLRAIGTSLQILHRLQDPMLELYDSSGALLESNDNWIDSSNKQAIIDSTIPPTNDLESAIVVFLPANGSAYTAVVRGSDGGTGIGLVEVYDLESAVDSKLANISTRGFVQTGNNVLIAGTIVTGQASQKVIIRAIGPSLPILGKLEDPSLQLLDANGTLLAANDNWRTGGQEAEITATGIPPSNELESAIVFQLPSNNASYTAIVRGVGDSTGIALVEVYALAPFSFGP
jgi:hypothetical protein